MKCADYFKAYEKLYCILQQIFTNFNYKGFYFEFVYWEFSWKRVYWFCAPSFWLLTITQFLKCSFGLQKKA